MGTHASVYSGASDADEAPSMIPGVANVSQSGADVDHAWRPTYIFQDAHRASIIVIVVSDEPGYYLDLSFTHHFSCNPRILCCLAA